MSLGCAFLIDVCDRLFAGYLMIENVGRDSASSGGHSEENSTA